MSELKQYLGLTSTARHQRRHHADDSLASPYHHQRQGVSHERPKGQGVAARPDDHVSTGQPSGLPLEPATISVSPRCKEGAKHRRHSVPEIKTKPEEPNATPDKSTQAATCILSPPFAESVPQIKTEPEEPSRSPDKPTQAATLILSPTFAERSECPSEVLSEDPEEVLVGHGQFQLMTLFCAHISAAMLVFHHLSIRLLAPSVDHWCKPPAQYAHLPVELWKNTSIPLESTGIYSRCTMYDAPLLQFVVSNQTRAVVQCVKWDHAVPPGVETIESQWDLVCDKAWYLSLATLYYILGGFVLVPLLAQVSDKAGRRNVIFVCVAGAVLSDFAVFFAKTFASFVVARMFLADAVNLLSMGTFVLLFEVTAPDFRDLYCCVAQLGVVIGSTAVAVLENFLLDKKLIILVGLLPTSMLVFSFYAIEDSPRWLVAKLDYRGAKRVLLWSSHLQNECLDFSGFQQVFRKRKDEDNQRHSADIGFFDPFTKDTLRDRTIALCCMWFCLLFALYGMWHISPKAPGLLIVLLATVPRVATVPLSYVLLKLYNRKTALGVAFPLACGLACLLSMSVEFQKDLVAILHELTLSSILLVMFVVYTYSLELFPTVMRVTGLCAASFSGRIGAMVSPFLADLSQRTHPSVPLLLIAVSMISARGFLQWLPETKYARIPDTLCQLEASMLKHAMLEIVRNSTHDQNFRNKRNRFGIFKPVS